MICGRCRPKCFITAGFLSLITLMTIQSIDRSLSFRWYPIQTVNELSPLPVYSKIPNTTKLWHSKNDNKNERTVKNTDDEDYSHSSQQYPPAAIFFNGNPTEPRFLWTYSFSRVLRDTLPNQTLVYVTKAREEKKVIQVSSLPLNMSSIATKMNSEGDDSWLYPSERNPSWDLREISKSEKWKIWPQLQLIFSRSLGVNELLHLYPQLFRFCEASRNNNDRIDFKSNETSLAKSSSFCPILVHFPIGQNPCKSCSSGWYKEVPDKEHLKPPSADIWQRSHQIRERRRPPNLSQAKWSRFQIANCSIAYVSSWSENKGQLRLAEELVTYHGYYQKLRLSDEDVESTRSSSAREGNWLLDQNLTICFGGKHAGTLHERTFSLLDSIGVKYEDFGILSLVEQLALFSFSGKSILLTAGDFSPRVVYLSLVAGARVLVTDHARIASPVVDGQCLATTWRLFREHSTPGKTINGSIEKRAKVMEKFMLEANCQTMKLAESILQEKIHYVSLIKKALRLWNSLNFEIGTDDSLNRRSCVQLYKPQCEKYFSLKKKIMIQKTRNG